MHYHECDGDKIWGMQCGHLCMESLANVQDPNGVKLYSKIKSTDVGVYYGMDSYYFTFEHLPIETFKLNQEFTPY